MSQALMILNHLLLGNTITPLEALSLCGSLRLSERIRELEKEGHCIDHEMVKVGKKRVCQYSLVRFPYG